MNTITFDFEDGNGPVPAHRHSNGRGWVIEVADAAVQGMIEGGIAENEAKAFHPLFQAVYNSGYNEAIRKLKEPREL